MAYLFYRAYLYYDKHGSKIPKMAAVYYIGGVQILILFLVAIIFNITTGGLFSAKHMTKNEMGLIFVGICFLWFTITAIRYVPQKKFEKITRRYMDSKYNHLIKTWQVMALPPLLIIAFIVLALQLVKHH